MMSLRGLTAPQSKEEHHVVNILWLINYFPLSFNAEAFYGFNSEDMTNGSERLKTKYIWKSCEIKQISDVQI